MTFFVEGHAFRGFTSTGGPLFRVVTLGFLTVGYMPWSLAQTLGKLKDKLRDLIKGEGEE